MNSMKNFHFLATNFKFRIQYINACCYSHFVEHAPEFLMRHIGPNADEEAAMLNTLGYNVSKSFLYIYTYILQNTN